MRKIAIALLAAGLIPLGGLAKAAPEETGPACANAVDGTGGGYTWNSSTETGTFTFEILTEAPSCPQFDYTVIVLDSAGGEELGRQTQSGNGTTFISGYSITFQDENEAAEGAPASNTVCAYGEISVGQHVFDVIAPDGAPCGEHTSGVSGAVKYH